MESKEEATSKPQLHMRERAIARSDDLQGSRVENHVMNQMKELGIKTDRWRRARKVYKQIAGQYPATIGKAVSKKERDENPGLQEESATNFVYGEIHFDTFALALEKIRYKYEGLKEPGGVFVDVGSGTGKPVFGAMLMHEFDKVVGIEILNGLHDIANELNSVWHEIREDADVSEKTCKTSIELLRGDAFHVDWSDADVAFCNSTCFDKPLMQLLSEKAELMRPGSFFITFTRRLQSDRWQVLEYERHPMSWGEATVFIHQRKPDSEAHIEQDEEKQ